MSELIVNIPNEGYELLKSGKSIILHLKPENQIYEVELNEHTPDVEAYQKAFEDIRADIMHLDDINPDYPMDMTVHLDRNEVLTVIDKHNPGKVGKERE